MLKEEINLKATWRLVKADIIRKILTDGKRISPSAILVAMLSPPVIVVLLFRLQHYSLQKNIYFLSKIIAQINIIMFSVEIGSQCRIAEGFLLGHANGVVIHDQVIIGKNCTFMHQCSIGLRYQKDVPENEQFVIVEEDVLIGSGARIMGPCVIGKGSRIGMNAVVLGSFPERSFIAGVPATVIRKLGGNDLFPPEYSNHSYTIHTILTFKETLKKICQDLKHRAYIDGKNFSALNYLKMFLSPPAMAVFLYRWAAYFESISFKYLAKLFTVVNIILFKTEIGVKAEIDGGLVLGHANGVLINNQVKIGKNAVFYHHNSVAIGPRLGLDPVRDRVVIGNNFIAGAGARILGNIELGDDVVVGLNAVVTRSAPDGAVLVGVPAVNIKKISLMSKNKETEEKTIYPCSAIPSFKIMLKTIKKDIKRRAELEGKRAGALYFIKVPLNPPVMAVIIFRIANFFKKNNFHFLSKIFSNINIVLYTVEIQPSATIGPGLVLAHANGILIHDNTIIGKNCIFTLQNSVTVGPRTDRYSKNDITMIGDNVFIGMGARIIGNIKLGNNVSIGANAVVTRSAPNGAALTGIPARQR